MSLSNQDAKQLRTRLERNSNLSIKSKTILNTFINNKKNAFDRSTFMQQYNAKMRNLRSKEPSLGKRKRSPPGNLNSAMENSNGYASNGSVNPGKRGQSSPRGPLSAVSGASNTSNNENVSMNRSNNDNGYGGFSSNNENGNGYGGFSNNENNLERNTKRRKNNSQAQAATNKAAANNARRKAVANAKKKAILARQQVNVKTNANAKAAANAKAKENYNKLRIKRNSLPRGLYNIFSNTILQNAVKQGRYQNMNTQINSKIKLANNNERRIKIQLNKIPIGNFRRNVQSKINNVRGNNSKTTALLQQINTEQKKINANAKAKAAAATQAAKNANANAARARANANAAIANARVNVKINNLANIRDVVTLMLSKDQLIEIAKNLKVSYTKSNKVPKLKDTILKHNNKNDLIKEVNNQLVGDAESKKIAEKVNSYISGIRNIKSKTRPKYTASLVILYIKDLSKAARTKVITNGRNLLQLMNGINSRTISNNNIKKEEQISNEEFTDLVFIMWLDGVHDNYITKTLDTWFNETTLFSDTQKKLVVKGWNTPFIQIINSLKLPKGNKNILTSSLSNFSSGWEKDVKTYLTEKYKNDAITISTSLAQQVTSSIPQNINIGVDQEYTDNNENSITRFIQDHANGVSKTDVNTLITYGQAFDPGRSMVSRGVHEDIEKLTLDKLLNKKFISKKKYYLCDMKIDLKVGNTSVFKLQVQKDLSNNVNASFNNKKILTGISGGQAGKAKGDVIAVSKYFGDALQYYSLAVMDNRTREKKTERFFFGSGDSMALLGYDRVCEILKKSIRMVIDFPTSYGPKIYVVGLNGTVRNAPQPAYSTMTGAGVQTNNTNNAISK